VNFQELVIENPCGFDGVRSGSPHQLPVHRPMADHFIKPWVGKYRLGTIDWLPTGLQGSNKQHECQTHA
jgi:hypothetical protein